MKLHQTFVNKLVKVYEVNSGYREEYKLIEALQNLNVAVYTQTDGTQVLVDAQQLQASQTEIAAQQKAAQQQRLHALAAEQARFNR